MQQLYIYIYIYINVKKAHDVTVMSPKLDTYFLHSLHGQFFGFHSLIPFRRQQHLSILSTLKVQYRRF